jgi:hypothetical protein
VRAGRAGCDTSPGVRMQEMAPARRCSRSWRASPAPRVRPAHHPLATRRQAISVARTAGRRLGGRGGKGCDGRAQRGRRARVYGRTDHQGYGVASSCVSGRSRSPSSGSAAASGRPSHPLTAVASATAAPGYRPRCDPGSEGWRDSRDATEVSTGELPPGCSAQILLLNATLSDA